MSGAEGNERGRSDANNCFVCGPENPVGLRVDFRMDGPLCRGEFTPGGDHVGYDGMIHGGILYSLLDDVMANWFFLQGGRGHTGRCEIRYRDALPVGVTVRLEAQLVRQKGRLLVLAGKASREDTGAVVAETQGSFMMSDPISGT